MRQVKIVIDRRTRRPVNPKSRYKGFKKKWNIVQMRGVAWRNSSWPTLVTLLTRLGSTFVFKSKSTFYTRIFIFKLPSDLLSVKLLGRFFKAWGIWSDLLVEVRPWTIPWINNNLIRCFKINRDCLSRFYNFLKT